MGFWSDLAKDIGTSAVLAASGLDMYDTKNDRELTVSLRRAVSRRDKNTVNEIVEKLYDRGYEHELIQALTMSDGMDYLEQIEEYCDRELFDLDDLIIEGVVCVNEEDMLSAYCVAVAMQKYMNSITSARELSQTDRYVDTRMKEVSRIRYSDRFMVSNEEIAFELVQAMKEGDERKVEYAFQTLKELRALNKKEILSLIEERM